MAEAWCEPTALDDAEPVVSRPVRLGISPGACCMRPSMRVLSRSPLSAGLAGDRWSGRGERVTSHAPTPDRTIGVHSSTE